MESKKIIIVGSGIGGLTAALSLFDAGFRDIHIFESVTELRPLGVGINVQPSGVLILRNLGLLPALEDIGVATKDLNYFNRHGDVVVSEPRGKFAGYDIPQFSVHRGEIQMLLFETVKERIGADRIHLGHLFTSFTQTDDSITANFTHRTHENKAASAYIPSITGDMVIAADGINSTTRKLLDPNEGPPRFSGRMLWRGCMEQPTPYLSGASMIWAGHADQKFIAYPISGRVARKGHSLVNWIAEKRIRDANDPDLVAPPTDWNKSVPKEKFAAAFANWGRDNGSGQRTIGELNLMELFDQTEKIFEFPMCDRDPLERWTVGRLTLLGDAAHAMYPIGSNGATQAILDAEALAACLVKDVLNVPVALRNYQDIRLPPTARIVLANRANGPDQVLELAEDRAPDGFKDVSDIISQEELEAVGHAYKQIAGFEKTAVNEKAKNTVAFAKKWEQIDSSRL